MIAVSDDASVNSSLIDVVRSYVLELIGTVSHILELASNLTGPNNLSFHFIYDCYDSVITWLAFDEFQLKLLKGFLLILCSNVLLILISWKIFGRKIFERFMKPPTSSAIEELKNSVSLLKLPKEHSPRV